MEGDAREGTEGSTERQPAGGATARPTLLVRRAARESAAQVAALLRDIAMEPEEVADLIRHRDVLVLSDITLPPDEPPMAAAAFRVDGTARTADLIGVVVMEGCRRQGHGRRLLTSTLTMLRAQGVDRVLARARPGSPYGALLVRTGFIANNCVTDPQGRIRYLQLL
jgi:ribosomal protein S18 acetylase RimI-like enzyme